MFRPLTLSFLFVLGIVPQFAYGYSSGPPPFVTGDPKAPDSGISCTECHTGTALNGGGGGVQIVLPGAATYVPGQAQTISVTISDSKAKRWGFEFTARMLADNTQSGSLTSTDAGTFVQCGDGSPKGSTCPTGLNTQFVQQTNPKTTSGSATFTFQWTPPTSGTVVLYAAGNGANGDGSDSGDHIYTTSIQLTAAAAANTPTIASVQNGASFQGSLAGNTYLTIKGQNLSTDPPAGRIWAGTDFTSNSNGTLNAPTSLDGTSVTINGAAAYLYYVSPGQLNVISPGGAAAGNGVPVVVTVKGQASPPFSVTLQPLAPAFFEYFPGTADDGKYLVAQHGNFTDVGKAGLYPTAPTFTSPAKPGETIILYGTGFGTTSPVIAPGLVTDKLYNVAATPLTATVGNIPATIGFAGLAGGFFQVFQFNITIPPSAPDGDLPLVVNVNGTQSFSGQITVLH